MRRRDSRFRRFIEGLPAPENQILRRTRMVEIELSQPLSQLEVDGWTHAHVLVRLHGQPLGALEVSFAQGAVAPATLSALVGDQLAEKVHEHLSLDGLDKVDVPCHPGETRHRCLEHLEPASAAPLVTVVIPTRNRTDQLAACLDSILRVHYKAFEVVIVDNAPSDSSARDMVQDRFGSDARVRYVRQEPAGASLARNVGARAGRGRFVAFTDDDAVVDPLWLAALVAGFRAGPRVVCVSGLTLPNALETPAQQAFEAYGGMSLGFEPRLYDLDEHRGDTRLYPYTAGIFGASNNVAFRRDYFVDRGGFDVTLGPGTPVFGAEDLDLFLAVILDGHQIAYQPAATVRHAHRAEFGELYWQVFTYSAGFTALLTKWALTDRQVAGDLMRRVPGILPAALLHEQRSGAEAGVGDYGKQLRWLERAGYLYGPLAYLLSRAEAWRDGPRAPRASTTGRRAPTCSAPATSGRPEVHS